MPKETDYEKDYLCLYRDRQGKFSHYHWYPADLKTPEELKSIIEKWNIENKDMEDGKLVEQITDPLVREICSHNERVRPFNAIISEAKEVQESISQAIDTLESALCDLRRIKGLD